MPKPPKSLSDANTIQAIALNAINSLNSDLLSTKDKALKTRISQAISALSKTWDTIEERKRILRGKPLPGSIKNSKAPGPNPARNWMRQHRHEILEAPTPTQKESLFPEPQNGTTG